MKACKECHLLTDEGSCPICGAPTSPHWHGYLIIIDTKSKIAEKMNIEMPGKYALKVR